VESALAAQEGGADRIEFCDNLLEGGTTPSYGAIEVARSRLHIDLNVIIRPRGGDFCYSDVAFEVMKRDIMAVKALGVQGVVLGVLNPDGTVDAARTGELISLARPMRVAFHRAFDMTRNPFEALNALIALKVDCVLTSGQASSALNGLGLLKKLVELSDGNIVIMAGGGVTPKNARRIVEASGVKEIHVGSGCAESVDGKMKFRNPGVSMGGATAPSEYMIRRTSAAAVRSVVQAVNG
jgi:copper homeostasis protein